MSERVEEQREAQRLEQARLAKEQGEAKRLGQAGEFKKVVASLQQHSAQMQKQQGDKQAQHSSASARLLVRDGAKHAAFAQKLGADGERRLHAKREQRASESILAGERQAAVSRSGARGQGEAQKREPQGAPRQKVRQGERDKKEARSGPSSRHDQLLASHAGIHMVQGLGGTGAKASGGASGARPLAQQVIDQIVKAVRQGVDARGLGMIEVDLKDDVLGGARLQINSSPQGIKLRFFSGNKQVSRLLQSGTTAHELTLALRQRGINLQSLEVNP